MKWLHVLPSVDPRRGGPIEGVRNIGAYLTGFDHSVEVATLDDPGDAFLKEFPLPVHALGPSMGSYRYSRRLVPWLKAHAKEYDAVIINGIWQFSSFGTAKALRGTGIPYYVFPHGMLDPWFKRRYPLKHFKKWLYWPWGEYRVLRDARAVLFTCEEERRLARESFGLYRANEKVVGYGIRMPPQEKDVLRERFLSVYPELRGKRNCLFLGRLHPKKGCDILINAFSRVASIDPSLCLVIAGPDETGWIVQLKRLAHRLGVSDRITWTGMLKGDMKWGSFYSSEAFVLPSHQENFGIAVAEAMACELPVLISNQINIWREIEEDQAGIVDADTVDGTERTFRKWLAMSVDERKVMGNSALQCVSRRFTVEAMSKNLVDLMGEFEREKTKVSV